jgi:hypothetical protein
MLRIYSVGLLRIPFNLFPDRRNDAVQTGRRMSAREATYCFGTPPEAAHGGCGADGPMSRTRFGESNTAFLFRLFRACRRLSGNWTESPGAPVVDGAN